MFIVTFMHNDKRNVLVPAGRSVRTAAGIVLVGCLGVAVTALVDGVARLRALGQGRVLAEVPLSPDDLDAIISTWRGQVVSAGTSHAQVLVEASSEIVGAFMLPTVLELLLIVGIAAVGVMLGVQALRGRLSWVSLARGTFWSGGVLAVGMFLVELLRKTASEQLSIWLYAQGDGVWWEPGFLSGVDAKPILLGIALAIWARSLRTSGRLAADVDGLV